LGRRTTRAGDLRGAARAARFRLRANRPAWLLRPGRGRTRHGDEGRSLKCQRRSVSIWARPTR
jgi:hypothetical protein